ncbi:MAG: hypothetical protein R3F49_15330 [Planctomycetota bacterium]
MSFFRRPLVVRADRLSAIGAFLVVLAVFGLTFVGTAELNDAEVEFQSTSAFARAGSLALQGTPEADRIEADLLRDPDLASDLHVRVVEARADAGAADRAPRSPRIYGRHGVGQVLVALPFYAAGRLWGALAPGLEEQAVRLAYDGVEASEPLAHLVVGLRNPLLGAGTIWLVAMCALRLGVRRRRAIGAALALAGSTFLWPQARSSLSDVQATFFLLLALHLVLVARERLDRLEMPPGRIAFGIGAALAMAFLSRIAVAPACALIAAVGESVLRFGARRIAASRWTPRGGSGVTPQRALLLALAPIAVGCAVFVGTNLARYGKPFDSGYGSIFDGTLFQGVAADGLKGLLLSPSRGLVWFAPLVLLAPIGIARALAERERLLTFCLFGVTALVALPAAATVDWHGASTYGPRYLLPCLPFLWLFVALALEEASRRPWIGRAALALFVPGFVVALGGVVVDHRTHDDLARRAAEIEWPDAPSLGLPITASLEDIRRERYNRTLWDVRFAAPLAHWRIFRHRVAGLGEAFPVDELYHVAGAAVLSPRSERHREFHHFGWREFVRRFDGPGTVPIGAAVLLVLFGVIALVRGLDRTAQ